MLDVSHGRSERMGKKFAPTGILYADRFVEFMYKKPHMTQYTFKGAVYYCMWKYQWRYTYVGILRVSKFEI